jgi:hypothetical protein
MRLFMYTGRRARRLGRAAVAACAVAALAMLAGPAGAAGKPVQPAAAPAGAVPGGAVPGGAVPGGAVPGGAVPGGFADWNALYAYQTRLNDAASLLLAAGDAGNASIVASPVDRRLTVYWKGPVPAPVSTLAAGLGVPVAFKPAAYRLDQLVSEAKRLAGQAGVAVAAPMSDGSGLAITSTGERSLAPLRSSVALSVKAGPRPVLTASRQADTVAYWGGARINNPTRGTNCSTGFAVRIGNFRDVMLTAGHCGQVGDSINIPGQVTPTGRLADKHACRDDAEVDLGAGNIALTVYRGPFDADSSHSSPVVGAVPDFVGNLVITDGAASGEHAGVQVLGVDQFIALDAIPGCSVGPLTSAALNQPQCASAFGDSGGPVISPAGTGSIGVYGRGTITASNSLATCPGTSPVGGNFLWYAPLVRPASDPQVGTLNAINATRPFITPFDLTGSWNVPGATGHPNVSVSGTSIAVDMQPLGRPFAFGQAFGGTMIQVTFPDDRTYTGTLQAPNRILWSNNTVWTKS